MKVLVCGGRNYRDYTHVKRTLDYLRLHYDGFELLIHGGAKGADTLAGMWALERGVHIAIVPALWDHYGKAAGAMRNSAMLALNPSLVVAFPGGRGTLNMKGQAEQHGIEVIEIGAAVSAPDLPF